jgi:hypothetical protein
VTGRAGPTPGVVKIRLSGELGHIEAVAALIGSSLGQDIEQIERSAAYPNQRDSGVRVYLTVLVNGVRP